MVYNILQQKNVTKQFTVVTKLAGTRCPGRAMKVCVRAAGPEASLGQNAWHGMKVNQVPGQKRCSLYGYVCVCLLLLYTIADIAVHCCEML